MLHKRSCLRNSFSAFFLVEVYLLIFADLLKIKFLAFMASSCRAIARPPFKVSFSAGSGRRKFSKVDQSIARAIASKYPGNMYSLNLPIQQILCRISCLLDCGYFKHEILGKLFNTRARFLFLRHCTSRHFCPDYPWFPTNCDVVDFLGENWRVTWNATTINL